MDKFKVGDVIEVDSGSNGGASHWEIVNSDSADYLCCLIKSPKFYWAVLGYVAQWDKLAVDAMIGIRLVPKTNPLPSVQKIVSSNSICECGKEKHGFASHSTWCKLWEAN